MALSLSPWVPSTGPVHARHIGRDWLQHTLAHAHPGAVLEAFARIGGTTGTTDRTRLRLRWNEAGVAAGLPKTVFVKCTPLSAKNRAMVGPLQMAATEVRFYRGPRADLGEIAPTAHATNIGRGARFLLLLEDLIDRGCEPYSLHQDVGLEHLEAMMQVFGELHGRFWQSPRFETDLVWLPTERHRPAFGLLQWFHRRARRRFLDGRESAPSTVLALAKALSDHEEEIAGCREAGPLTLVHGDCHLGNTYRTADGRGGLLDWQIVHRGAGLREIAYFLGTGAPIELRRRHERELIALYLDALGRHGVRHPPTPDAAWEAYRFWIAYGWDAVQLTRTWTGLQTPAAMEASWTRINAAVGDLDVASAVLDIVRRGMPREPITVTS